MSADRCDLLCIELPRAEALRRTRLDQESAVLAATRAQALADPTRLTIVRQLAAEGEVCACDFTACCGVSQPTVSHHLKVLREAGLIRGERRGTWIYYSLEPSGASRLQALVASVTDGATRRPNGRRALPVLAHRRE